MKRLMVSTALVSLIAAPLALANPAIDADVDALPAYYDTADLNRIVLAKIDDADSDGEFYQTQDDIDDDMSKSSTAETASIVDIASNDPRLDTLTKLIGKAGLEDTLNNYGPFTVFAPTDEAFEALPESTLDDLMSEDGQEKLTKILKAHVATGALDSVRFPAAGLEVLSLNDTQLDITRAGETITIENASVTEADISAGNGVIHVIDKVILPDHA